MGLELSTHHIEKNTESVLQLNRDVMDNLSYISEELYSLPRELNPSDKKSGLKEQFEVKPI